MSCIRVRKGTINEKDGGRSERKVVIKKGKLGGRERESEGGLNK